MRCVLQGREAAVRKELTQSQHTGSPQSLSAATAHVITIVSRRRISGSQCHLKPNDCLAAVAHGSSGVAECPSCVTGTLCDVTITKIYGCPPTPQHICTLLSLPHAQRIPCSAWRRKTGSASLGCLWPQVPLKPCVGPGPAGGALGESALASGPEGTGLGW